MTEKDVENHMRESEEAWRMMNMSPDDRRAAAEALQIANRAECAKCDAQIASDEALARSLHDPKEHDAIRQSIMPSH